MKVYDEHGQHYPAPERRRDEPERRDDGPPQPEQDDSSTVDLTELLAGDA